MEAIGSRGSTWYVNVMSAAEAIPTYVCEFLCGGVVYVYDDMSYVFWLHPPTYQTHLAVRYSVEGSKVH